MSSISFSGLGAITASVWSKNMEDKRCKRIIKTGIENSYRSGTLSREKRLPRVKSGENMVIDD